MPLGSVPASSRPCAIDHQAGDVALAGGVICFALARPGDAEDAAAVAGARVERAIGRERERPDVFRFRIEVFRGLAVFDAIDFSVGRTGRIDDAGFIDGDGEDLGAVGGPEQLRGSVWFDAEDAAAMAGGGVERAIRRGRDAPDDGLFGGEKGVELRGERKAAVAAQRDAIEFAFDEIGEAGHLPGVAVDARQWQQECQPATDRTALQNDRFTL